MTRTGKRAFCPSSHPYMGHRESRPGFRAWATFFSSFLTVSLFGLRSPFLRPGPPCQLPARAGSVKDAHLRAREGFVLDGPEHTGRLGTRRGDDVQRSRDRPLCQPTEKGPLNLIRLVLEPNPYPTCWGREEAGLDGTNLLAGIEAMNLPGHTSIPVRRTQLQRAASDKLVTPP